SNSNDRKSHLTLVIRIRGEIALARKTYTSVITSLDNMLSNARHI
ncbi:MAG: hypothetical protein ACI9WC_003598, partial [Arenicella sp.]